ncbi:hypothetical protein N7481_010902 [Penicillium waksmanii]|uniref:uncharacterized protein n=1 Tax=Penicillium waksmanii TaxID=69791 RepID=UPI0025476245|nr:uncharacterized protein N7481_010902 [Penicillium waksmanii]KAJ5973692.1 hypothetical protein N7481_010902 [Penicillium waksmanii]
MATLTEIKARYYISSGIWLIYSHFLGVKKWAAAWIAVVFIHYVLRAARFGPLKDLCMTAGIVVQLMACWEIGGSDAEVGWSWVKLMGMWSVPTVPIQDFRDVPGDSTCGRRTTPILLGNITGIFGSSGY